MPRLSRIPAPGRQASSAIHPDPILRAPEYLGKCSIRPGIFGAGHDAGVALAVGVGECTCVQSIFAAVG
jgi:hypothetical protein